MWFLEGRVDLGGLAWLGFWRGWGMGKRGCRSVDQGHA